MEREFQRIPDHALVRSCTNTASFLIITETVRETGKLMKTIINLVKLSLRRWKETGSII